MASLTSTLQISTSSVRLFDSNSNFQSSPQCITLPPPPVPARTRKHIVYCRKNARNVVVMATGGAPAEAADNELPEIVKTVQETWDKVDDKYAVSSLIVAGLVALWTSTGVISAIDRLPLLPGVLELVGIGYTGWFTYKNLIYKPDREALLQKVEDTYKDVLGTGTESS